MPTAVRTPAAPRARGPISRLCLGGTDHDSRPRRHADVDILFGGSGFSMSGRNRLLLNDGKGGFTEDVFSNLAITPAQTKALAIGDVDNDGGARARVCARVAPPKTRLRLVRRALAPPCRSRCGRRQPGGSFANSPVWDGPTQLCGTQRWRRRLRPVQGHVQGPYRLDKVPPGLVR